jgi:hypothetical protein
MSLTLWLIGMMLILWIGYGLCWVTLRTVVGVIQIRVRRKTGQWDNDVSPIPNEPATFVVFVVWLILLVVTKDAWRADTVCFDVEVL